MGNVWEGPVLAFVFAKFRFPKTVECGCAVAPPGGAIRVAYKHAMHVPVKTKFSYLVDGDRVSSR